MIIINQQKNHIANFDNAWFITRYNHQIWLVFGDNDESCDSLGQYESEERLLEVFEDLRSAIVSGAKEYQMPEA